MLQPSDEESRRVPPRPSSGMPVLSRGLGWTARPNVAVDLVSVVPADNGALVGPIIFEFDARPWPRRKRVVRARRQELL